MHLLLVMIEWQPEKVEQLFWVAMYENRESMAWLDVGNHGVLLDASDFVAISKRDRDFTLLVLMKLHT